MHECHYVCNRCGSSDVELNEGISSEDIDDEEERPECWCNDCGDMRFADVEED